MVMVLSTRDDPNDKNTEKFIHLSKGMCTRLKKIHIILYTQLLK